ncbi:titin homolog isoform X2 [Stomoxys calcitrans]|uniref:titin homolog isoform X2 n=1 Tax=Stomoxys calcitrans TaxID=35570 RepID=UPI0027E28CAC|nr:titin homolog isoform X2 [Stomoxys calcitrans]
MSKKMWNKIFKTKSSKNAKALAAANKVNKRCSIYEEYQQLNAALDLTLSEKSPDNSVTTSQTLAITNYDDRPLPTSTAALAKTEGENGKSTNQKSTISKVVKSFTLKRSQNTEKDNATTLPATGPVTELQSENEKPNSSPHTSSSAINSYNTTTPTETPDPSVSIQLAPCPICSRTFNPVTLRKHVGICEKMATKRRNIFDSSRQRREGTELATYPLPKNFGLPEKSSSITLTRTRSERGQSPNPQQQISSPIMQRKKPSEEFIRSTARSSMRKLSTSSANDGMTTSSNFSRDRLRSSERSLTRRGAMQTQLPSEQCPHCDRCFGLKAYDRHVEWCKEKALQASIKQQASNKTEENVAKARLEARTKYRAPCLKTKRSMNRDKYSGAAGDENEDSPKSLKIGMKSHDTSLMSMSMTSSMTSESKTTTTSTKPTGNINEASEKSAAAPSTSPTTPPQTTSSSTLSFHSNKQKRSRDKSPQPPSTPLANVKEEEDDLAASDSIENCEMEMPDFRLMGEQMTTSVSSTTIDIVTNATNTKKIDKDKPATKNKEKSNIPPAAAAATAKHPSKQQSKSVLADHKFQADVMPGVPPKKKTPSDLSLKSMRHTILKQAPQNGMETAHKEIGGGVATVQPSLDDQRNTEEHPSPKTKVELAKSLTFYASPPKKLGEKSKSLSQEQTKISMEEYFITEDNKSQEVEKEAASKHAPRIAPHYTDMNECHGKEMQENRVMGSKKVISSRKEIKKTQRLEKPLKEEFKISTRVKKQTGIKQSTLVRNDKRYTETRQPKLKRQESIFDEKYINDDDEDEDLQQLYLDELKIRPQLKNLLKSLSKEKSSLKKLSLATKRQAPEKKDIIRQSSIAERVRPTYKFGRTITEDNSSFTEENLHRSMISKEYIKENEENSSLIAGDMAALNYGNTISKEYSKENEKNSSHKFSTTFSKEHSKENQENSKRFKDFPQEKLHKYIKEDEDNSSLAKEDITTHKFSPMVPKEYSKGNQENSKCLKDFPQEKINKSFQTALSKKTFQELDISDKNSSFASTPKAASQTSSKEILQRAYKALEKMQRQSENEDNEQIAKKMGDIPKGLSKEQTEKNVLNSIEIPEIRDQEEDENPQEQHKSLKSCISTTELFIQIDSDTEEEFITPPEHPNMSAEDFQNSKSSFRRFSPPIRKVKPNVSTMKDNIQTKKISSTKVQDIKTPASTPQSSRSSKVGTPSEDLHSQSKISSNMEIKTTMKIPLTKGKECKIPVSASQTPRPSKIRASTPPPTQSEFFNATPRSMDSSSLAYKRPIKLEISPVKTLSIGRPQRKRVPSESYASNTTLPMKAVPLNREFIEISRISSAYEISQEDTKEHPREFNNGSNKEYQEPKREEVSQEYAEESDSNEFSTYSNNDKSKENQESERKHLSQENAEESNDTDVSLKSIEGIKVANETSPPRLLRSDSFVIRTTKNRYSDLTKVEDMLGNNQKREIFISIETEQNDLDKSPISPNSIRHMTGNPQCVVEVEVDASDNKFSKISDDDEQHQPLEHSHAGHGHGRNLSSGLSRAMAGTAAADIGVGGDFHANLRQSLDQQDRSSMQTTAADMMAMMMQQSNNRGKAHKATGTPSGDAYADSDELSSLDGYPLSSPNSRLGVSSKTSADSAYGSLSRQRSSELTNPRNSSRNRTLPANAGGNVVLSRPLTEERARQLSASSSSSSEHALPPIGGNNNYQKQQHVTQMYNNNNINNNTSSNTGSNAANNMEDMLRYERNNNFDVPIHPTTGGLTSPVVATAPTTANQQQHYGHHLHHHATSHEPTPMSSTNQLYGSNSTMSSSMKMSKFCHECGSKFLLDQAKFCMDCGVKRICL